jgi:hypothetical protein
LESGKTSAEYILFSNNGDIDNNIKINNKTITLSCNATGASDSTYYLEATVLKHNGNKVILQSISGNTGISLSNVLSISEIKIVVKKSVANITFKPQIEIGNEATQYAPFINNFSGVQVFKSGKNLYPDNINQTITVGSNTLSSETYKDMNPILAASKTFTVSLDYE